MKSSQNKQDDGEDDEEIKKIIMNNLNEKLKLSLIHSKQNRSKNFNSRHTHLDNIKSKNFKNISQRTCESSSHSSIVSDDFESTSGSENDGYHSNEYFKSNQRRKLQQPCQKLKQNVKKKEIKILNNNNYSSSTTTSNENEVNSDESKKQSLKINAQKINCRYCRSLTSFNRNNKNKNLFYSTPKHLLNKGYIDYGVYTNFSHNKGHCDERMYAYDNFDCINECIKEENESQISFNNNKKEQPFLKSIKSKPIQIEESQNDTETDNEKCFSSILVEDGFIRMSSPVYCNEDFNRIENIKKNDLNKLTQNNQKQDLSEENHRFLDKEVKNRNSFSIYKNLVVTDQSKEMENFPNVGNSPLPEDFNNLNGNRNESISNDQYNQDTQEEDYEFETDQFKSNLKPDKTSINKFLNMSQSDVDRLLDSENFDFDGIIHYSRNSNFLNNEIVSLSDEDDILVEGDKNDEDSSDYDDDENDFDLFTQYDNNKNFDIETQINYVQNEKKIEGIF